MIVGGLMFDPNIDDFLSVLQAATQESQATQRV